MQFSKSICTTSTFKIFYVKLGPQFGIYCKEDHFLKPTLSSKLLGF